MVTPTISIIMNCYNNAATLPEALQSVFDQTFTDWQIIFWDNGSCDNSSKIAKSFDPQGEKLHYFYDNSRISLGHVRNEALSKARGEYVAFLDCDDVWLPEKLAKQIQLFKSNAKLALICSDTENFRIKKSKYQSLGRIFETASPHRGSVFEKLIMGQWIAMSSVMLRRSCLENMGADCFDAKLNICEEAELFYRLARQWEFDYVPEVLTKRRVHENSTTFTHFTELAAETEYILQKQFRLYPDFAKDYPDIVKAMGKRVAFQKAVALWRDGMGSEARMVLHGCKSLKANLFYVVSFLPPVFFPYFAAWYLKCAKYIKSPA